MSITHVRNVDTDLSVPVGHWPLEALRSVLERGDLSDYRRIVDAIAESPWGPAARRVEQVLEWTQPYGTTAIMRRAIDRHRHRWAEHERASVRADLAQSLTTSGLSRGDFAQQLGTSASRLSTYLSGSVVPSATLMYRARAIAEANGC